MPFYRITILLQDDKILQGIREHDNNNIDYVTNFFRAKASATYGKKLVDIEAAMLSKNSSAVKNYLEDKLKSMKRKINLHQYSIDKSKLNDRKRNNNNKPTLGEISEKKD